MRTLSQVLNDAAFQAESMRNEIVRMEGDLNILYKQRDALKAALEECYAELCEYAPKYKLRPENQYQKALNAVKEKE